MALMNMTPLLRLADGWQTLAKAEDALRQGSGAVHVESLPIAARPWLLARLVRDLGRPLVVVTYTDDAAQKLAAALPALLPADAAVRLFPSELPLLLDDSESERDVARAGRRLAALAELNSDTPPRVIVTTATALLTPVASAESVARRQLAIKVGDTLSLDSLAVRLNAFGYARQDQVRLPGTFARRGDLLDVFPSDADAPVRIDLFGDEVETIRPFDPETQRSAGGQDAIRLLPAHELAYTRETMASTAAALRAQLADELARRKAAGEDAERLDKLRDHAEGEILLIGQAGFFPGVERYRPLLQPDAVPLAAHLSPDWIAVFDEPAQLAPHAERDADTVWNNLRSRTERGEVLPVRDDLLARPDAALAELGRGRASLSLSLLGRNVGWLHFTTHLIGNGAAAESFGGRPGPMAEALATWVRNGVRVAIVSLQAPRVRGVLQEKGLPETPLQTLGQNGGGIALVNGGLDGGFRLPDAQLVILSDNEVFGTVDERKKRVARREFREGMRITSLLDIRPGDYVVHIHHGIGQYHGLHRIAVQGVEREYLLVVYDGGDKLYVPVDQVDRVQKYIGSEAAPPAVNKLGGTEWIKATARARRQAKEIAGELIALYAARQAAPGHAYPPDTPWVREMEDAFPYVETPDQYAAIEDVKRDLETPRPMDRLICGDVGYGKTEVAIRAAFKVASEGRQVAILCPTTVLAAQHYQTFAERLAPFPVAVDMLSRFRSPKEQQRTTDAIRSGAVDIVIATHRLLSKDIEFKDLGLVIVDEEQRFGVVHKERLKQLRRTVDVLTMTATPIPRTLHMALSGIRDMSLINDPPEGRLPVKTYIKEFDDLLVREAILRELDRGGQVYFLHNRVESIYHVAHHLERQVVPGARIRVAHGQMSEDALEEAMLDFYQKKFDILVCTTIVESGLDIPNVNTILIDHADKLGLAQLYQLRGRVGRSRVQAYAYLLYPRNKRLSTVAEQRLDALREFSDLGSGYKIALRDLELRGAGNLLGAEQSGMVATVGFDLYCQLLEEAIHEVKGEEPDRALAPLPAVDIPVAATLPEKYIPSEPQRILLYKKLAAVRDRADVARLQEELEDRFGDPPPPVWNALSLLRLRLRCQEIGIESIATEGRRVTIQFKTAIQLPRTALRPLAAAFKGQGHHFESHRVTMEIQSSKILQAVEEMVELLARALSEPPPPRVSPRGSDSRRIPSPKER